MLHPTRHRHPPSRCYTHNTRKIDVPRITPKIQKCGLVDVAAEVEHPLAITHVGLGARRGDWTVPQFWPAGDATLRFADRAEIQKCGLLATLLIGSQHQRYLAPNQRIMGRRRGTGYDDRSRGPESFSTPHQSITKFSHSNTVLTLNIWYRPDQIAVKC